MGGLDRTPEIADGSGEVVAVVPTSMEVDCRGSMETVVCGIDPGLGMTGYAVLRIHPERLLVIEAGVCQLDAKLPLAERLTRIQHDVSSMFLEHQPDLVAVEEIYAHYKHPRTAIRMAHARGVILSAAARLGIEVRSYAATQVKRYLTGNGRATKSQVQRAIQTVLRLTTLPEPADVADAMAIAVCCAGDTSNQARATTPAGCRAQVASSQHPTANGE